MVHYGPEVAEMVSTVPDLYTRPLDEPIWVMRDVPAMLNSRYYREFIRPQGSSMPVQLNMVRQRDRFGSMSLSRHEHVGIASERDLAICRLLAPHTSKPEQVLSPYYERVAGAHSIPLPVPRCSKKSPRLPHSRNWSG
jgi:hypothetical protein